MHRGPESGAPGGGPTIEAPVGTGIAWHGVEEIIRRVGVCVLVGELTAIAVTCEIAVEEARSDLVGENDLDGGATDPNFASACMRCEDDRPSRNLGLEDRRDRLRPVRHPAARPIELRGIERRPEWSEEAS